MFPPWPVQHPATPTRTYLLGATTWNQRLDRSPRGFGRAIAHPAGSLAHGGVGCHVFHCHCSHCYGLGLGGLDIKFWHVSKINSKCLYFRGIMSFCPIILDLSVYDGFSTLGMEFCVRFGPRLGRVLETKTSLPWCPQNSQEITSALALLSDLGYRASTAACLAKCTMTRTMMELSKLKWRYD